MSEIDRELAEIRRNNGRLTPESVVQYAREHTESALHASFTWDESEAAEKWRLHQARNIIRVRVITIPQSQTPVRAFVSLSSDRKVAHGGYRSITTVLRSKPMRQQMLDDAMAEFEVFRRKYSSLKALAPVFAAMDAVKRKEKGGDTDGMLASA